MKINRTALAAAASVVAVVVAGTAALAANFGILSGGGEVDPTPRILSSIGDEMFVDIPVQEVTGTTEASQTLAYQVEGVGVVTLTRTADMLAVASIDVDQQWTATQVPSTDGVSIRFTSGSQVIAFSASVIGDQVVVDVIDETPAPAAGSYDDDDHGSESQGYDDEGSYDDDEGSYDDD